MVLLLMFMSLYEFENHDTIEYGCEAKFGRGGYRGEVSLNKPVVLI